MGCVAWNSSTSFITMPRLLGLLITMTMGYYRWSIDSIREFPLGRVPGFEVFFAATVIMLPSLTAVASGLQLEAAGQL